MTGERRIALATPHARYDAIEARLREGHRFDVLRLRRRDELDPAALTAFAPSHVFFPHWSWKIPATVYDKFECVVFHMTDLPYGRGGSPLQNLVVRGIENTRLTALRCVEQLDAGPVYLKRPLSTLGSAEEVFLRAAALMEQMIVEIAERRLQPRPQAGEAVIFERRGPAQGDLSQAGSLNEAHDLIRMLDADGYPPAFIDIGALRLEFSRASLRPGHVAADVRITLRGGKEPN